jgi:hypothetical protein
LYAVDARIRRLDEVDLGVLRLQVWAVLARGAVDPSWAQLPEHR